MSGGRRSSNPFVVAVATVVASTIVGVGGISIDAALSLRVRKFSVGKTTSL